MGPTGVPVGPDGGAEVVVGLVGTEVVVGLMGTEVVVGLVGAEVVVGALDPGLQPR